MAEGGHGDYSDQLSLLKDRIEKDKGVVMDKFEGLRENLNKKEKDTLEYLDRIYAESKATFDECMKDYEKLRAVMARLDEKLSDGSSLSQYFTRNDSEIEKMKPTWKPPMVEVSWNILPLYKQIDALCRVEMYTSTGDSNMHSHKSGSAILYDRSTHEEVAPINTSRSFDAEPKRKPPIAKDKPVFRADAMPPRGQVPVGEIQKQSVRLEWKKQHPTLDTVVQYMDNKDDSIMLEWNGESFISSTVEMNVGEHIGTLSMGDSELLPSVDPFQVHEAAGVLEIKLNTP